ncbi:MAG: hypothetical protein ACRDRK_15555 [Pseudonocardia sp.]
MTSRADCGGERHTSRDPQFAPSSVSTVHRGLAYPAEVAPEIFVRWDPLLPDRCIELILPDDTDPAVRTRAAALDRRPWLRLAAVTVLDRQLYLPLDRSLLDAEAAAARLDAARTLGDDNPVREVLIRKALVGARAASRGVIGRLEHLAAGGRRPPPALAAALDPVIRCYAVLSGEVRELDTALAGVGEAWHRLCTLGRAAVRGRGTIAPPATAAVAAGGTDQIDPRSVPARVLMFGPTPDSAEISVDPVHADAGAAVRVRVAAFSGTEAVDVGVRLIDRRSGAVRGYGLLGQPVALRPPLHFEGLVSLPPSLPASHVRVELFDAAGDPPVADGSELRRVRRAALFLSEWRALVADVRLWGLRAAPAIRLEATVRRLVDDLADEPLWCGGPSRTHLLGLVELGDRTLTDQLRAGDAGESPDGGGIVRAVFGPGDLLAAEVAAAYDRARPTEVL